MPNIYLTCSEADARLLTPYTEVIGKYLRDATALALNLEGPDQAAFRIVPFAAGDNAGRFEIIAVASQSLERVVNLFEWQNLLAFAWFDLYIEPKVSAIADIFAEEIEIWPQMPVGSWGLFEKGRLLRR